MTRLCLLIVALLLATPALAVQSTQPKAPQRLALLIGNWDYNNNGIFDEEPESDMQKDLRNPCQDVDLLRKSLEQVRFEVTPICNVAKPDFEQATNTFARKFEQLPSGSVLLIYYSGHGVQQAGYIYSLPVMFRLPEPLLQASDRDQLRHFASQAVDVQTMLEKFSSRSDLAIYIALDQCRNETQQTTSAYNPAVNIRTAENVMIQYSAGPGDYTLDNSAFAKLLAHEISQGGELGIIASRVYAESLRLYRAGQSSTYSSAYAGRDFASLRSAGMMLVPVAATTPARPPIKAEPSDGKVDKRKILVRKPDNNPSLDILWCEGEGEAARYRIARDLAEAIAGRAKEYGVGRVMVKPLPVATNMHQGYNVRRNLMRFDPSEPKERILLENVAVQFPELSLLPQRGVGVGGQPTKNYVSAFICEGFSGK